MWWSTPPTYSPPGGAIKATALEIFAIRAMSSVQRPSATYGSTSHWRVCMIITVTRSIAIKMSAFSL
eukprot:m.112794 g.112794  ORF g.112794 m.112794 type:complete len:67 (+) comp17042_c0_seq2:228-428(+)